MESNLSDKNFLGEVEKFIGSSLQKKDDIKKLIDIVVADKKVKEFDDLIFTSKYICGLMRVMKNAPGVPEVSSIDHVKKDLSENINKAVDQLKELLSESSKKERDYFQNTYTQLSSENFNNLQKLFSDLESVKKYLNQLKRLT
jgi:hypothetical protein